MPTKSNLKVFLRDTKRDMLDILWQMVGYHGEQWSVAQVAWRGAEGIQVGEQLRFDQRVISRLVCEQLLKLKLSRLCVVDSKLFYVTPFDLFRVLQILFEGEGFLHAEMNVAIDNIIVTTENCSLRPYFAEPGTHSLLSSLFFDYFLSSRDQLGAKNVHHSISTTLAMILSCGLVGCDED